jgi:hypothetical protein
LICLHLHQLGDKEIRILFDGALLADDEIAMQPRSRTKLDQETEAELLGGEES